MIAPQTGAFFCGRRLKPLRAVEPMEFGVRLPGANFFGAAAALVLAAELSACALPDFDNQAAWFSKPLNLFGTGKGYTYSDLSTGTQQHGPVTPNDLVGANGGCAPLPAAPPVQAETSNQAVSPAPDAASLLGGGIGLGMTECEVVYRAGAPSSVQLGTRPDGIRTATLRFDGGPRAGVYRFEAGRLMEMDRVEVPPSAPPAAKKKPAKSAQPAKTSNQT